MSAADRVTTPAHHPWPPASTGLRSDVVAPSRPCISGSSPIAIGWPSPCAVGLTAFACARQKHHDGPDSDLATLPAAYAFALARSLPFNDGNWRAAFLAAMILPGLNGKALDATALGGRAGHHRTGRRITRRRRARDLDARCDRTATVRGLAPAAH